jgi:hypothetical protein
MENFHLAYEQVDFTKMMENFKAKHGHDDFRMRWQGMILEMASQKNCRQTIERFGNKHPGPLELFLNYRITGKVFSYCKRHDDEFTFPDKWGEVPDIGETKLYRLMRIYEEK